MQYELIFNELSTRQPATSVVAARQRIDKLIELLLVCKRRTGSGKIRISKEFFATEFGPQYPIRKWLNDSDVDKETVRRLRAFTHGLSYIRKDTGLPGIADRWQSLEAWIAGSKAQGLLAAFLLDGLAVSLPSEEIWSGPKIDIEILSETDPEPKQAITRNISNEGHLDAHAAWLEIRDPALAKFRRLVEPHACRHKPASSYGKHVRGKTNPHRKKNAISTGHGQFLAKIDATSVTDAQIRQWETEALNMVWSGSQNFRVSAKTDANTFYIFHERSHPVGYDGLTGEEVYTLRVEWSSGEVHSHPRRLNL